MLFRLLLVFLLITSARANYRFAAPVTSTTQTARGAVVTCADGVTLEVKFITSDIVRITLVRPEDPEPLLTDALLADSLLLRDVELTSEETSSAVLIKSDRLTVAVDHDSLHVIFINAFGRALLADDPAMAYGFDGNEVRTWKQLAPGEKFFGLGEKGGGLDKRGRELVLWNSDIPGYLDSTDPLYQSIPFYIGLRDSVAYGIFFNNSCKSRFNFGAGQQRYSSFSAEDGPLDYFVINGPSIKEVVRRFSDLTGKLNLPPLWALGYQQSRWSYFPDTEVRRLAQTFREKDIPCDVIYLDIHYMDGYRVFTWDSTRFPEPQTLLSDLNKDGFKIVPIIDPGVKAEWGYKIADEGLAGNHFVRYPDHTVHVGEVWPGKSYFPDYSHPKTRIWWGKHVAEMRKQGVRGFWNDMNEPACWGQAFPLETIFHDNGLNSSHKKMHNLYALHMAQATYEGLLKDFPYERPFILTRAGFAGIQRYAASWTGDNLASEDHLELGIRLMLGMGLSGQPFVGTDIGGFMGTPSPELFVRWMQVGALSPFCRTHSHYGSNDKEPWSFGENNEAIARKFIKFRYELLPTLYSLFYQSSQTGEPIWRPLFYEFQNDPKCYDWAYQQQFMLGENILVAPVTRVGQYTKKVYLPEGKWLDWNTKKVYEGQQEIIVDAHLDWLPMFLRNGAILFRRDLQQYADQRPIAELTVNVFGLPAATDGFPSSSAVLYEDDGRSHASRNGRFRRTEYYYSEQIGTFSLRRIVRADGHTPADRKLHAIIHEFGKAPLKIWLNDEQITLADSRVSYDPERRRFELEFDSELGFKSLEIETYSPEKPERP
ncbi:MAG: DUF4968 domain-containing protein [bacterium]|nr:DUF4968 domain-containing protein [bacterium]